MKFPLTILLSLFFLAAGPVRSQDPGPNPDISSYQDEAQRIIDAAMSDEESFGQLTWFGDHFGPRFSGSENLERSIDWIVEQMKGDGFDRVFTQEVMVPRWVRGEESATLLAPREKELPMLGLGGSVGTPEEGIRAEVLVVESFEDLKAKADRAEGKIVLYDVPFTTYGQTVRYRTQGAIEAARVGAVASLIRSVTPYSMQTPHTGNSSYEEGVKKIPHAAITLEDASMLHRMQERGERIEIQLWMNAETLPDVPSRNVIAEIRGTENPEEIVVLGGHIDSWDVGQGVMDDAGGCLAAWEALKLIKELGLRPRRTVRVVLWTNEENGLRGANAYRDMVDKNGTLDDHVLAMESDSGVFEPRGYGFSGSDRAYELVSAAGGLLSPIGSDTVSRGGGGADIGPLMQEGVPGMGLSVDGSRYFWYHHTASDTIDKLNAEDYKKSIATLAVMAYVVADMPERLPRQ